MSTATYFGDPAQIVAGDDYDPTSFVRRLVDLRPDWHADAACADEPLRIFFPTRGGSTSQAYEFCGRCPVRDECLAEALADPTLDHGVRGGMSPGARRARRRREHGPGVRGMCAT